MGEMGARAGTLEKVNAIRKVLEAHKEGIWLREIARITGYSVGSIYYLIKRYILDARFDSVKRKFEDKDRKMSYITLVRLKR